MKEKHLFTKYAYRVTFFYFVFSFLWILLSDQILLFFISHGDLLTRAQTAKGWVFIVTTTLLLFFLLRRAIKNIEEVTLKDVMCVIPNRIAFVEKIERRCHKLAGTKSHFAIIIVDIAKFRDFNNQLGHESGDLLLKNFSECLLDNLEHDFYIARLSADEFGIITPSCHKPFSSYGALTVRVSKIVNKCLSMASPRPMNTHIAMAHFPADGTTSTDLIRNLDIALNHAKTHPKELYVEYDDSYRISLLDRLALLEELTLAIEKREFQVVYQPQWSFKKDQWYGVEVLIRWNHPTLGYIPPLDFISIAEEEGLIGEITDIVFEKAFTEFKTHHISKEKVPKISFNFSHSIIGNHSAIRMLEKRLKTGITSDFPQIIIELTETAMMKNLLTTTTLLTRWKKLGIAFSIDDFGTGYTSLGQLQQLPIDEIKIDRSFISGIPEQDTSNEITKAILAMAHKLGKSVVAEGVETTEQGEFLQHNHCDVGQGYFYAKPIPVQELASTLLQRPLSAIVLR